jgi:hypothetical protein
MLAGFLIADRGSANIQNPTSNIRGYNGNVRLKRRLFLLALPFASAFAKAEAPAKTSIRGKLTQRDGKPSLELDGNKRITLDGDGPTRGVLNDKRLAGAEMEAIGHFSNPELFIVDPIHTKALYVYKDGKRRTISYWCATCSIRTYSPGPCWCCQEETALDLQDDGKE